LCEQRRFGGEFVEAKPAEHYRMTAPPAQASIAITASGIMA